MVCHVLVPIDGSNLSAAALSEALDLAKQCGAQVSVFHVQPSYYGRPDVAIYGEGLVLDPALSEQFSQANVRFAATILDKALEHGL